MLRAALGRSGLRLLAETAVLGRGAVRSSVTTRWMCSKPEDGDPTIKVKAHRPSEFERKLLVWGGRFKKDSDIPEYVSYEMVDVAKSKVRVKFAVMMMVLTLMGCIGMAISGKQASKRHESLSKSNLERKARMKSDSEE